ncbi:MAG: pseudouridylate synthase [Myxococcales bacterium]|nr:pseudouridylate synthase [Myxococcales bacterium]
MISILYRDDSLLIVDKPAGILTHRTQLAPDSDVAMTRARDAIGAWVWPLHRLDRGTSGALAFGLSEQAARTWQEQLDAGSIVKVYLALVRGVAPDAIELDYPVPKSEAGPRVPARTAFRRLWAGDHCSLVEARPETGRFHQIRRHLSHLRHPIAGDSNYGTGWFNRKIRQSTPLTRLGLHCSSLAFPLPGGPRRVVAPLASDFAQALIALGAPDALVAAASNGTLAR